MSTKPSTLVSLSLTSATSPVSRTHKVEAGTGPVQDSPGLAAELLEWTRGPPERGSRPSYVPIESESCLVVMATFHDQTSNLKDTLAVS